MTTQGIVEQILPGGAGRIRDAQGEVLLGDVIAGEQVSYRPDGLRHGVRRAQLVDVLQPSASRCEAPCTLAGQCGGCVFQHVRPQAQAAIKSDWVRRALQSVWHGDVQWHAAGVPASRRRRVRWHLDAQGRPGFYAPQSHQLVTHAHCMALEQALNDLLARWPAAACRDASACSAVLLSDGIHAVLEYDNKPSRLPAPGDLPLSVATTAIQWWWHHAAVSRPLHRPVRQFHDTLPFAGGELLLQVGPDDFVQGNAEGNRQMIQQLQAWLPASAYVVDLFAGIGNLSLPLAAEGRRVEGFEVHPASVRAANATAKWHGLSAHYHQLDLLGRFQPTESMTGADCLILDPPRKGAKAVCRQLHRLLPRSIVMVHCDPASATRDAGLVAAQGYRLQAARALDLFPFSGHVECMTYWQQA